MKKKTSKFAFYLAGITGIIGAIAFGSAALSTSTVTYAEGKTTVIEIKPETPIMDRIAECESSANQKNKHGQLLIHVNTNGTYDIGKYQINSIHEAEATKLGFDLSTNDGNEAYAKWLYANRGTGDWYSSSKCWMK